MIDRRTFALGALSALVFTPPAWGHVAQIDPRFVRRPVRYRTSELPGTIIVVPEERYLYFVLSKNRALRYGVGVGRQGFSWSGEAVIRRKAEWPTWTPTKNMIRREPKYARWASGMPGGLRNPLGARALYLYQGNRDTLYRIHGTNDPGSIGRAVSSGCVRLFNEDIKDLFERVPVGTRVVVIG